MRARATTRVVACPDLHISRESPNGLRLSGERSGAERVRCSRGFGARLLDELDATSGTIRPWRLAPQGARRCVEPMGPAGEAGMGR